MFSASHEMSRHAIHVAEVLEATIDTVRELQHRQTTVHEILWNGLDETYTEQARHYVQFQISLLKNLKLRSNSNQARLKNEIDLVCICRKGQLTPKFVAIAGADSHVAGLQQPSLPRQ